jgi:hypothetical protein
LGGTFASNCQLRVEDFYLKESQGLHRTRQLNPGRHPRAKKTHDFIIATQNFNGTRQHDRMRKRERGNGITDAKVQR